MTSTENVSLPLSVVAHLIFVLFYDDAVGVYYCVCFVVCIVPGIIMKLFGQNRIGPVAPLPISAFFIAQKRSASPQFNKYTRSRQKCTGIGSFTGPVNCDEMESLIISHYLFVRYETNLMLRTTLQKKTVDNMYEHPGLGLNCRVCKLFTCKVDF